MDGRIGVRHDERGVSDIIVRHRKIVLAWAKRGSRRDVARQDFETDFWKHANLRKVWDEHRPRRAAPDHSLYADPGSQSSLYCKSVGEDHPIYFDEAYAKTTRYGGLIAPPSIHIMLMFSCTPADDWMRSPGTINVGQSWSYKHSARGRATLSGSRPCALDKFIKRERLFVVHDNVFFNGKDEVICSGRGWTIRPSVTSLHGAIDHDDDIRRSEERRHHRRAGIRGQSQRIDPAVLRRLARLQPAASRRRLHEGQFSARPISAASSCMA